MVNIYNRSYNILKPAVDKISDIFKPLETKLKIAHINTTYEKYGAFILLMSIIIGIVGFIFITLFGSLLLGINLKSMLTFIFVSALVSTTSAIFFYLYPNIKINERKSKIDNALPFVTIYLSTIMKSGIPPQDIFKPLTNFKRYKTLAQEARKINSDIKGLGMDLPNALNKAIARSPSANWTELLAGLRNSIIVGGDIGKYLEEKAKGFIKQYKRRLEEFSKLLALLMNVYITVVIVGLVFFVVISSLMVTIGGVSVEMVKFTQYLLALLGLPMVTALMIIVIKSSSPWEVED